MNGKALNFHSTLARIAGHVAGALLVVFLVTLIAFALAYLSPTDAAVKFFTSVGIAPTEEQLAQKRAELGLDQPAAVQYLTWLAGVFQGDLGESMRTGKPVVQMLFAALPYTLFLSITSIVLALAIALPTGMMCAARQGGVFDKVIRAVTYLFNSLPSFFVALLLLYVFSVQLKVVNVISTRDLSGVLLPTLALALPLSAWLSRQIRAYALDQLSMPYVDGLRSRGVSENRILWVHVMRNIAVPLLTLVGVSFGMMLGGSAIVESIFSWPGLGFESIEAVGHRDYPFISAYALTMAVLYLVVNGLVDFSYRFFDPRVKMGGRAANDVSSGEPAVDELAAEPAAYDGATAAADEPGYEPAAPNGAAAMADSAFVPLSAKEGEVRHA